MGDLMEQIIWLEHLGRDDVAKVGGKNASLGELIRNLVPRGIAVPAGFATTADAYWQYVDANGIRNEIAGLIRDWQQSKLTLAETGSAIRKFFLRGDWPEDLADAIRKAYVSLSKRVGSEDVPVAVRSSATSEDLPNASFAGQQETFSEHSRRKTAPRCLSPLLCVSLH